VRRSADVVIVGGGVIGAACAHAAARAGLDVLVVELAGIAAGTTGAGEGNLLVSDKPPGPELDLALLSLAGWAEIADEQLADFELERKGGLVTAAGPDALTSGSSTRTAGRLLTMLDSTAAAAAMPSSASNVSPAGSTPRIADSRPCNMSPSTTTPKHRTNTRNGTSAADAIRRSEVSRRASARTPSTTAPASAAQAGEKPSNDVTANPNNVDASTTRTNTRTATRSAVGSRCGLTARSRAKSQRSSTNSAATASSHGGAISAVKWRNDRPAAENASRLVRFDTGSSSDAVLARCAVA